MTPCLTGGGRVPYRLDLEIIKSPSTSWTSNSSSPSSTLSESSNCPNSISTRKPRKPRKRPNQNYNEAAAILSSAHPKIFPTKHLTKFTKSNITNNPLLFEPSDLLIPFKTIDTSEFLLLPQILERPEIFSIEPKPCQSPREITSYGNVSEVCDDYRENQDFDAESILDEEKWGLDSILGNLSVENELMDVSDKNFMEMNNCCYGFPVGLGFDYEYGMKRELRAIRSGDEGDWWRFPSVNVNDLNPKIVKIPVEKKKKKKVEIKNLESVTSTEVSKEVLDSKSISEESTIPQPNAGLHLKLNYDDVLNAWDDKVSPFSGDGPGVESAGNDVQARLAQINLFSENGGVREASVLRYKEKRRTRLFSKKIRYQVRKVNADRRPRMKGRFVRTPNSPDDEHE